MGTLHSTTALFNWVTFRLSPVYPGLPTVPGLPRFTQAAPLLPESYPKTGVMSGLATTRPEPDDSTFGLGVWVLRPIAVN
jgi:hypothetical protein